MIYLAYCLVGRSLLLSIGMERPDEKRLPEADLLPDGFIDGSAQCGFSSSSVADSPDVETFQKEDILLENNCSSSSASKSALKKIRTVEDNATTLANSLVCNTHLTETNERRASGDMGAPAGIPKYESKEGVRKNEPKGKKTKKTAKLETDAFLELTWMYQQVVAERDASISTRDKLEKLCRELHRQNKNLMDELKHVMEEGQSLRSDLTAQFQNVIKDINVRLEDRKEKYVTQLNENEMLREKLKQLSEQFPLCEERCAQKLQQKSLELELSNLKMKQHEEKWDKEHSQMKTYTEQIEQLMDVERRLRAQLAADDEKFQQYQEALSKSSAAFETSTKEIEKMANVVRELQKENMSLKSKCERSDFALVQLLGERQVLKQELERTAKQKEKLESLCRTLRAQGVQNSST